MSALYGSRHAEALTDLKTGWSQGQAHSEVLKELSND